MYGAPRGWRRFLFGRVLWCYELEPLELVPLEELLWSWFCCCPRSELCAGGAPGGGPHWPIRGGPAFCIASGSLSLHASQAFCSFSWSAWLGGLGGLLGSILP